VDERTLLETNLPPDYGQPGVGEATRVLSGPGMAPLGAPVGGGYEATQQAIAVTCPVCGTPNGPAERYCQDCGLLFGSTPAEVEPLPDLSQLPRLVDTAGREFALNPGPNSVGRDAADLLIADPTISRRHAQVTLEGGQLVVEDLGSTNGTKVGDRRLDPGERVAAFNGDTVRFGSVSLTLTLPGGEARPADLGPVETQPAPAGEAAPATVRGAALGFLVLGDGTEFPLYEGVNSIGRRSANQITLADAFMSGKHAEVLVQADGTAQLVDVGSTNGSFLGEERLAPHAPLALTEGLTVRLGKTPVTFRAAAPPPAPPGPEAEAASDPGVDPLAESAVEPTMMPVSG